MILVIPYPLMIYLVPTFRLPDLALVDSVSSTSRGRAMQEETRRKPRKSILLLFEIKREKFESVHCLNWWMYWRLSQVCRYIRGKGGSLVFPLLPGKSGCPSGLDFG